MVSDSAKALIVESDSTRARRLAALLETMDSIEIQCYVVHSLAIARKRMAEVPVDIFLTGLEMIDSRGLDSLVAMNSSRPEVPVVALVEGSEPDIVLDAVRSLSDDCLYWCELDKEAVQESVFYALERKDMLRHLRNTDRMRIINGFWIKSGTRFS